MNRLILFTETYNLWRRLWRESGAECRGEKHRPRQRLSGLARLPWAAPPPGRQLLIDYLSQAREALGQVCVKELRLLEAARDRIDIIRMAISRLAKPLSCLRVVLDERAPDFLQGQLLPDRYRFP